MPASIKPRTLKNPLFSAVVPVYNESALAVDFVRALASCLEKLAPRFEIIAIDDGSKDDTSQRLQDLMSTVPQLKLISFSRNFGKEKAVTAGLHHTTGDLVLIIDSDFQHPLETIPVLFDRWKAGYDNVYAVRTDRKDQTVLNRFFANNFYRLNQSLMNIDLPANAGDFRILDKKVVDAINLLPEANRFMKGLYAWVGFKGYAVPYEVQPRKEGKSRWNFRRLLGLAITGITSFSDVPLRIWSGIGLGISVLSFLYGLWIIADTLIFGSTVPGFATLATAVMFFGGLQLLSIGIIGEYVGRIFTEVKQRPLYLIGEKHGFNAHPSSSIDPSSADQGSANQPSIHSIKPISAQKDPLS
jgi:glycosyltransferase involved in cell wall biosynthesis